MLLIIPSLIKAWCIWELLVINGFCENCKNFLKIGQYPVDEETSSNLSGFTILFKLIDLIP